MLVQTEILMLLAQSLKGRLVYCRSVHGLDATAAQTFGTLYSRLQSMGVELVLAHLDALHTSNPSPGPGQQVRQL